MSLRKIQNADVKGKTIFLRADLDIPLRDSEIEDATRLEAWFITLDYLLSKDATIIVGGHLGRPEGVEDEFSLAPIAKWIAQKISSEPHATKLGEFNGWTLGNKVSLLENLRFYKEEEENEEGFAKQLASRAEIYVNDSFAASHRGHASIVGVPKIIPGYSGLRLQKEVEELSKVMDYPQRPFTIIVGGAKIETKLPLISKMHQFADYVLVGGEIAEHIKQLAKVEHEKVENRKSELLIAELTSDKEDISEESIQKFIEIINKSKTIVWNGPMGEFEKCFDLGTREVANAIARSRANTVVGGGDTVSFLNKEGILGKFSFASTGGGAMLEFLAGDELPGLEVLKN